MGLAFIWQNGKFRDLGTLPRRAFSRAYGLNETGQVVGDSFSVSQALDGGHVKTRAFLWQNGRLTDLGSLPGSNDSEARAINSRGQIIGYSYAQNIKTGEESLRHAFLWQNGRMTKLGTLPGGRQSAATAINNHGQIVGYSTSKNGNKHAVLRTLRSN